MCLRVHIGITLSNLSCGIDLSCLRVQALQCQRRSDLVRSLRLVAEVLLGL
jgi:hypothetical protein